MCVSVTPNIWYGFFRGQSTIYNIYDQNSWMQCTMAMHKFSIDLTDENPNISCLLEFLIQLPKGQTPNILAKKYGSLRARLEIWPWQGYRYSVEVTRLGLMILRFSEGWTQWIQFKKTRLRGSKPLSKVWEFFQNIWYS